MCKPDYRIHSGYLVSCCCVRQMITYGKEDKYGEKNKKSTGFQSNY
jgi:hypothetical protein